MAWNNVPLGWRSLWRASLVVALVASGRPMASFEAFAAQGDSEENFSGEKPEIVFPDVRLDLGEVTRGQRIQRSFPFKNSGKGILEIRSIHSTCGCINTKADPKSRFAPGEEGRITFDFDSSWFSGSVVRAITVDSNDPSNPATILSVVAHIDEEIRVNPALITLGEIPRETSREYVASIEMLEKAKGEEVFPPAAALARIPAEMESIKKELSSPGKDLRILAAIPSSPNMQVELVGNEGRLRTLRMRFKGQLPSGPLRERITLWNTSTNLKELVVPVVGEVVSHVRPSTRYIEFGAVRKGSRSKRTLTLEADLPDFKIESVSVDLRMTENLKGFEGSSVITHEVQKTQSGFTIGLEMRVPAGLQFESAPVNVSGTVVVKTNDADVKELKIPFFGVLQQEARK